MSVSCFLKSFWVLEFCSRIHNSLAKLAFFCHIHLHQLSCFNPYFFCFVLFFDVTKDIWKEVLDGVCLISFWCLLLCFRDLTLSVCWHICVHVEYTCYASTTCQDFLLCPPNVPLFKSCSWSPQDTGNLLTHSTAKKTLHWQSRKTLF